MKGIVFSQFLDFVEERHGLSTVDQMIKSANLESGGAYTTVGTYDHQELSRMLSSLSQESGIPISDLLRDFGKSLFHFLAKSFPEVVDESGSAFDVVANIDGYIHKEVRKLYPDAELPTFLHERIDSHSVLLTYQSQRGLADLAEGLLQGCFEHFGDSIQIVREDLSGGRATDVRFVLQRSQQ